MLLPTRVDASLVVCWSTDGRQLMQRLGAKQKESGSALTEAGHRSDRATTTAGPAA